MNLSGNNRLSIDNVSVTSVNSFSSKIRRLKIQENVLAANVNKCVITNSDENNGHDNYQNTMQLKKYFTKLKDKFRELNHLFEEITLKTNDHESFKNTDIDELKRNILELETKIRTMKQYIRNELQTLQNDEIMLTEREGTPVTSSTKEGNKLLKFNITPQIKEYKEIVPSPVRVIINSPFKCLEVQQFQDFMKNSPRYGGWNEYNHNLFVQIWNKYYGENNMLVEVKSIEATYSYKSFREEVVQKISGSSLESIDLHCKWYSKYLYLKSKQQEAVNKWKDNKRKLKPTRKTRRMQIDDSGEPKSQDSTKLCRRQMQANVMDRNVDCRRSQDKFSELAGHNEGTMTSSEGVRRFKKLDVLRLSRPTKQSLLRRGSEMGSYECNKTLESIAKLRIPSWRLSLFE